MLPLAAVEPQRERVRDGRRQDCERAGMDRKMIEAAKGDARPQRESHTGKHAVGAKTQ
jgi:hypothetical protein